MPYKDQVLQRQAVQRAVQKHRGKGITSGITIDKERAIKLARICNALDKKVTGLDGKQVNLLEMVFYGNIRMDEVKRQLEDNSNFTERL